MNKGKVIMLGIAAVVAMATSAATITNVTAKQRYPWNGKVDITYEVMGEIPSWATLRVLAKIDATGTNIVASSTALSGDTDNSEGLHHIVWDL